MKKGILSLMAWSLPFLLMAQRFDSAQRDNDYKGIKWVEGHTWEQVKEKAKAENKYIFLDCYATWCGPCKAMDKNVYKADSVGNFFNEKFISVKVQMDKTANDNDEVKKWHADADNIAKIYHIEAYPALLFFNPQGKVTDQQLGYKSVEEFVAIGKSAIIPGKLYDDPYAEYYRKVAAYKEGQRNYDQYPAMIKFADKLNDTVLWKQLTKEFTDYTASLPAKERYTKERIELWSKYLYLSNTKEFGYFYNDPIMINRVMGKKNYAEDYVEKIIQYEIVLPFLKYQAKGSNISMDGAYLTYVGTGPATMANYNEADWEQLEKLIRPKYGKDYAKRIVLKARVEWYTRHMNTNAVIKYTLKLLHNYPTDLKDISACRKINAVAWDAFLSSTDKRILKEYAKWMKKIIQNHHQWASWIDTYANLLYKSGHVRKAIKWQEKAVELANLTSKDKSIIRALEQMKKGHATHLEVGAVWPKIEKN